MKKINNILLLAIVFLSVQSVYAQEVKYKNKYDDKSNYKDHSIVYIRKYVTYTDFKGVEKERLDDFYGVLDGNKKLVVPCIYQEIRAINKNGITAAKLDKKHGMIDVNNKIIVDFIYEGIYSLTTSNEYYTLYLNKKHGLVDGFGNVIVDCKYDEKINRYIDKDIYPIILNGKAGVLGKDQKMILKPIYDKTYYPQADQLLVKLNGKEGLFDMDGKPILDIIYDEFYFEDRFDNKIASVELNGKYAYYISKTKFLSEFKFDHVWKFNRKTKLGIVEIGDKKGTIDLDGNIDWSEIKKEPLFVSDPTDKLGIYDEIGPPSNGYARVKKKGKYGYINVKTGELKIPYIYDEADLIAAKDFFIVKKGNTWLKIWGIGEEEYSTIGAYSTSVTKGGLITRGGNKSWVVTENLMSTVLESGSYLYDKIIANDHQEYLIVYKLTNGWKSKWYLVKKGNDFKKYTIVSEDGKTTIGYTNIPGKFILNGNELMSSFEMDGKLELHKDSKYDRFKIYEKVYPAHIVSGSGPNPFYGYGLDSYIFRVKNNDYAETYTYVSENGFVKTEINFSEALDFYENDVALVKKYGHWGVIDPNGDFIVPCKFDTITGLGTLYAKGIMDGKTYKLSPKGECETCGFILNKTTTTEATKTVTVSNTDKLNRFKIGNMYGFKLHGVIVIPAIYNGSYEFKGDNNIVGVKKGDNFGCINKQGEVVIPLKYDWVGDFSDGMMLIKKDGKFGYVNSKGQIIVQTILDKAEDFNAGSAVVVYEGSEGTLDKKGVITYH